MAHLQGEYERAKRLLQESETPARELGDRRDLAYALLTRGYLALTMRDDQAALDAFREALGMTRAVGDPLGTIWGLEGMTAVLSVRGQASLAARLVGVVEVQRAELRVSRDPMPGWREIGEQVRAGLRRTLGQRAFDAATAEGRRLAPDRAVSEALGQAGGQVVSGGTKRSGRSLSRREWEVAQLVARGLTNRQVARELVIAEGTAQRHVANILEELSLASRAELATWVATDGHGLPVR